MHELIDLKLQPTPELVLQSRFLAWVTPWYTVSRKQPLAVFKPPHRWLAIVQLGFHRQAINLGQNL